MKLATIVNDNKEEACILLPKGLTQFSSLNRHYHQDWPCTLQELLESGRLDSLHDWFQSNQKLFSSGPDIIPMEEAKNMFSPPYRYPHKIWGIGLNYAAHASDLSEKVPSDIPASFIKPDTTVIGYGHEIKIPLQSNKTTAEAELGIIIGKKCRNVNRENWLSVVAGFTAIIDMTAEDILRKNPRYLTLSKSFDTFFSFGPFLVTPDEISDINSLKVSTIINRKVHAENLVSNMTFPPDFLVSFHSKVMTLLPGDIISTGTPGAVHIRHGDIVTCKITGFDYLNNPVVDLKEK